MKLTKAFFDDIRELIRAAHATVARGVDLVQVHTNFEIGRRIVEQEQRGKGRAAYGEEVIGALADRLTKDFGNGFSRRNLAYMRTFYLLYSDRGPILQTVSAKSLAARKTQTALAQSSPIRKGQTGSGQLLAAEKLQTLSAKSRTRPFSLSWSHYVFLWGIKNPGERSFYEIEATGQDWPLRELKRQFDSGLYERLALSRDKAGIRRLAKKGQLVEKPQDILKEPLVLEFLGLDEQARYSESDLESAIISNRPDPEPLPPENPNDLAVELMGIEPTASRVRWRNDGHDPSDLAELERQQTPESVPEPPILATCSQNSEAVDPVSSQLENARREWSVDRDARRLRRALLVIMGLLDG